MDEEEEGYVKAVLCRGLGVDPSQVGYHPLHAHEEESKDVLRGLVAEYVKKHGGDVPKAFSDYIRRLRQARRDWREAMPVQQVSVTNEEEEG